MFMPTSCNPGDISVKFVFVDTRFYPGYGYHIETGISSFVQKKKTVDRSKKRL